MLFLDHLKTTQNAALKTLPVEIYDQVSCDYCEKVFNDKKALYNHFLCWKIMRWALSFAQHTPVSAAFKNQTTLCGVVSQLLLSREDNLCLN